MSIAGGSATDRPGPRIVREPDREDRSRAVIDVDFEVFAKVQLKRTPELGRKLRIPGHAAEEILQECLLRLWRERATVDRERWEGWLWKAIRFRRLKHFRALRHAAKQQQTLTGALDPSHESARPDVGIHLAQCDRDLRDLIEALAPARRAVVRLYLLEELPLGEVAARLGIPENTAKDRWRLAQIDMRAAWERGQARERTAFHLAVFLAQCKRAP